VAQKVNIILVSDLSGGEADETVSFALDGTNYELDLSSKEADKFRGLFQDYVAVARKTSSGRGRKSSGKSGGSGRSDLADVRAWAKEQGMEVSERGRVSQDVLSAYDAAH
jgi:hypothetical protein